jgi:outer membrane murein-binding lipoprotein Lpp
MTEPMKDKMDANLREMNARQEHLKKEIKASKEKMKTGEAELKSS